MKRDMLLKYCVGIADEYNIKAGGVKSWFQTWVIKENMSFIIETCNYIYCQEQNWLKFIGLRNLNNQIG